MFVDEMYGEELICYANLSGNVLTVLAKDQKVNDYVKFESNFEMTVSQDGKTLSFTGPVTTSAADYEYSDYTATKN